MCQEMKKFNKDGKQYDLKDTTGTSINVIGRQLQSLTVIVNCAEYTFFHGYPGGVVVQWELSITFHHERNGAFSIILRKIADT